MKFKILTLSAICILTLACEKKVEEEVDASTFVPVSAMFFDAANFTSSNQNQLFSSEVEDALYNSVDLWYHYDDGGSSSGSMDQCLTNFKFKSISSDTVYVGGQENIVSCLNSLGYELDSAVLKTYVEIRCEGVDLSSYDGMVADTANMESLDSDCGTATQHVRSNSRISMSMTSMGQQYSSVSDQATMTTSGATCRRSYSAPNWTQDDGCHVYSKNHDGNSGTDWITDISFTSLVASNVSTDAFYVSGTANIEIDGWSGTVTYAGASANAAYSLTDGSTTETGSLTPTPPSSLSVQSMSNSSNFLKLPRFNLR